MNQHYILTNSHEEDMSRKRFLTAREAATELDVSPATLYSYVSRGLIRSESGPEAGDRRRRYHREDIDRLKRRKELRREPGKVTERALHWGTPLLESSITLIADNALYYRGQDVTELAGTTAFEEVTRLLWNSALPVEKLFPASPVRLPAAWDAVAPGLTGLSHIRRFSILLQLAEEEDIASYDTSSERVALTGGRIIRMMASVLTGQNTTQDTIARALVKWSGSRKKGIDRLMNAALVLCADHELNVSSFTTRCVASAGSTPYSAVAAGLGALQGTKHGGHTGKVESLLKEIGRPSETGRVISDRLRRGEEIAGFGHTLYPDGDPRGRLLLDMVYDAFPRTPATTLLQSLEETVRATLDREPTIDFALVALARNLKLPPDAGVTIFAMGRTAGWIGHAIEQYRVDRIIRPRARYTGRMPGDDAQQDEESET